MADPSFEEDLPNFSEICVIGRDLTEFSVVRFGSFIRRIDLSFNLLTKVRGLEGCRVTLEELVLDNNQLEKLELKEEFPKLHTLSLNKNRILYLSALLKDLTKAPNLRYLSLLGNPICPDQLSDEYVEESEYEKYRRHTLNHIPNLRFLDHRIVSQKELSESRKLSYAQIKISPVYTPLPGTMSTASTIRTSSTLTENNSENQTTTAPAEHSSSSESPQRKGKQGRRRFKYVGKNSEGNRFIKDSDL